ncbi:hypothetical protein ABES03_08745 [Neobacillus rhizosphaerae]|uniref:hypothetical protein n=1 Tax=Neobacillus rhizosphaerae TaxID=2880965 RepID=UPI003D2670AD
MKTVVIEIHYISLEFGQRVSQSGEFKLYKNKTREQLALEFWKWIKRESLRTLELEKVKCDREDITNLVRGLL